MALVSGILSLQTLEAFHIRAVEIGILKEDMECRANTIVWDLRRCIKIYHTQLAEALDLLPDEINIAKLIEDLKKIHKTNAKKLITQIKKTS
jgi:hypothetical protein